MLVDDTMTPSTDTMTGTPSTPSLNTSDKDDQLNYTTCPADELLNITYTCNDEELLSPQGYYTIGATLIIIAAVGIVWNFSTLIAMHKRRNPKRIEFLIKVLLGSDLCMCVLSLPFAVTSSFGGHWLFGSAGCSWYGFSMFCMAVFSINILTAICIERFFTVKCIMQVPASARTRLLVISLVVSSLGALLCSTPPLLGLVSPYKSEGVGISCSLDWMSKKPHDQAYFIAILICCFVVPLGVIVTCYSRIYIQVASSPWSSEISKKPAASQRRIKMEIHLAKTIFLTAGSFVLVWSPYAVISFIAVITDLEAIPPIAYSIPALFAKCSVFCNSFVYVFMNRELHLACLRNINIQRNVVETEVLQGPTIPEQLVKPSDAGSRLEPREPCFTINNAEVTMSAKETNI